jgi:hypothetical protein
MVQYFVGLSKKSYNTIALTIIQYPTISIRLFSLHFDQGFTKNDPNTAKTGCEINISGISVSVITLFVVVQDLRGLVSHNNSSATCMEHHPVIINAIHLKYGLFDVNNIAIEINASNDVFALDSTL